MLLFFLLCTIYSIFCGAICELMCLSYCLYCLHCLFRLPCLFATGASFLSFRLIVYRFFYQSQKTKNMDRNYVSGEVEKAFYDFRLLGTLPRLYSGGVYPPPGACLISRSKKKERRPINQQKINTVLNLSTPHHNTPNHIIPHYEIERYNRKRLYINGFFSMTQHKTSRHTTLEKISLII